MFCWFVVWNFSGLVSKQINKEIKKKRKKKSARNLFILWDHFDVVRL